jgi:flavin-binding protein dodecin
MADVVKVIELVGSSPDSFSSAVKNAVATASETVRNITGVDVISSNADVENGQITRYKVQVKIAFVIDSASVGG